MKWFKHLCDSNRSVTIRKINKKYGLEGEARYWRLVEICSEKYECGEPEFTFDPETVRQTLRHRSVTDCRSFVDWLATAQLLIADTSGIVWRIKFPKILEIRDNHTRNLQAANKLVSDNLPLEEDKDKDVDVEEDKHTSKNFTENEIKELENVLRKKLDEKTGFLVSKHALKILQHFGSRESFSKFSERIQKNYEKSKQRDIKSLESYMVGAIHKEIDLYD